MRSHAFLLLLPVIFFLSGMTPAEAQWIPLNPVIDAQQQPDGALITLKTGFLRLRVCTPSILRVMYSLDADVPARLDFIVTKTSWPHVDFTVAQDSKSVDLKTARLTVKVNRANSALTFLEGVRTVDKSDCFRSVFKVTPPSGQGMAAIRRHPSGNNQ